MKILHFFFALTLLCANVSFAQSDQQSDKVEIITSEVDVDFSQMTPEEQKKKLAELVHAAEEASEGGESAEAPKNKVVGFAKEYASKMNIPKVARGMYRWYNVMEGKYPSIAADLSIMLLASHTTEMLSGPVGVAMASAGGAPEWVQWSIGVTGGVISIPGLDPLCIALGLAYVKIPAFRKGVTKTRIVVMRVVSATGVDRMVNWFVQKQNRVDFIQNAIQAAPGKYTYLISAKDGDPGLSYEFKNPAGAVFARVDFERNENGIVSAKRVQFDSARSETVTARSFSSMLGLFNSNVSQALSQAYRAAKSSQLNSLKSEYHVTNITQNAEAQSTEIEFRPSALKLTAKRSWSEAARKFFNCNVLLNSHNSTGSI